MLFLAVRQIHSSAWLLVGLSSLLQVLIFPLPGYYVLSWVAFAPLIVALLRARTAGVLEMDGSANLQAAKPGQAFLLAYTSGILWYAGTCYWIYDTMHQFGGMSPPLALLALFLFCLYLGLYHGLFGLLLSLMAGPDRDNRLALAAAPFLWVAVELARTLVTGFPWNLLGTAQVDNISLSRITTWTGVYGVSFEIVLVNVAVAAAFLVPRKKRNILLMASLAAAAVLQAGRLIDAPALPADRAALLVQENIPVDATWTRDRFERTLRELTDLSVKAMNTSGAPDSKPGKVDLIVWPESPAPFFANDPLFRDPVSAMARETHTWVVTGAIGSTPVMQGGKSASQVFNSAALISPSGDWTARYDKVHLVPFGEYLPFPQLFAFAGGLTKEVGEFRRGASRAPLHAGGTPLGIFICYESVFPGEVRQFSHTGCAGIGESIERRLVWRQRRLRTAFESDAHARYRERPLAVERNEHRSDSLDRSLWPNCSAAASQRTGRAGCSLCPHLRNHVLYAPRRLVRMGVCDNFCRGAGHALQASYKR